MCMAKRKYTKQLLESLVKKSLSVAQVIKGLGLNQAGGTHSHISRRIKEYNIDTSHFLGQGINRGKSTSNKIHYKKILVLRKKGYRRDAYKLRRALIESGREYKCVDCGNKGIWNKKPVRLQVDHKNRNWLDDREKNLEFRCPNCHSQTKGWCGSVGLTGVTGIIGVTGKHCK